MDDRSPYDYRNCQSLFGYAAKIHARSHGVCALCGYGSAGLDFDQWRQLTVEHVIGESQGGYPRQIREALRSRLPELPQDELERIVLRVDAANTVTACSFCNSTTSRSKAPRSMTELIAAAPDGVEELVHVIASELRTVLAVKQRDVLWKLESVRSAFEAEVVPPVQALGMGK